jgi:hypothetical protein
MTTAWKLHPEGIQRLVQQRAGFDLNGPSEGLEFDPDHEAQTNLLISDDS